MPGEQLEGVQCLYSHQDLQQMELSTKQVHRAVIVGGGLIGVEMAEMLRSRKIDVTMLVREEAFWSNALPLQEARMLGSHIRSHEVDLRLETELKLIHHDKKGRVGSVTAGNGETIPAEFVGIAVGVAPNVSFLSGSGVSCGRGVLVNEFLETNVPGIYAVGDCVERTSELPGRSKIEQVWYTGRMMGEVVASTICGERKKYEPGPWFNSAKFFDVEFQAYGRVGNMLGDGEMDFYWQHESGTRAMHFVWKKLTGEFLGVNSFGIRLRHEIMDRWLRTRKVIDEVIGRLPEASFDPEFTRSDLKVIQRTFAREGVPSPA